MGRWCPTFGGWCAGSCCAPRVLDGCFVSLFLDSNPAWLLGPTANRFARIVRVRFDSSAVRWGSRSCLLGLPPPLLWRAGHGLLSFPCLDRVRVVVAPRGRMLPLGVFGYLPFIYGLAAAGVAACGSGTRDPLVWGWCGFRAWRCRGVGDDGMPRDCACWVRLRGFLVFACGVVRRGLRTCACLCAPCLCACCRAPCFGWGVLLRSSQCVRAAVCLSVAACGGARCWFVAVYFGCRLLHGVRFVSAPALPVTWFMLIGAGVHLTATVAVAYCLPRNGRFQRFALFTGMPVVFVSVSHRHKGRWGESGARGRWRLAARRTT